MNYWIGHNVEGDIRVENLHDFLYETGSRVVYVCSPKDEGVLRD